MIRKLEVLAVALVATLALAAPPAQASQFTADEYPATIEGVQESFWGTLVFRTAGGREVYCAFAGFKGSLAGPSSTLKVSPEFGTSCWAIVLGSKLPATVTTSKPCEYEFHLFESGTNASFDFECSMTVDIYANSFDHATNKTLCQLHTEPQENNWLVEFWNQGNGDMAASYWISLAYTRTGSASCGASGNGTYQGGTVIVRARNKSGESVDLHAG